MWRLCHDLLSSVISDNLLFQTLEKGELLSLLPPQCSPRWNGVTWPVCRCHLSHSLFLTYPTKDKCSSRETGDLFLCQCYWWQVSSTRNSRWVLHIHMESPRESSPIIIMDERICLYLLSPQCNNKKVNREVYLTCSRESLDAQNARIGESWGYHQCQHLHFTGRKQEQEVWAFTLVICSTEASIPSR